MRFPKRKNKAIKRERERERFSLSESKRLEITCRIPEQL